MSQGQQGHYIRHCGIYIYEIMSLVKVDRNGQFWTGF